MDCHASHVVAQDPSNVPNIDWLIGEPRANANPDYKANLRCFSGSGCGVKIEHQFLVTSTGLEQLDVYPYDENLVD